MFILFGIFCVIDLLPCRRIVGLLLSICLCCTHSLCLKLSFLSSGRGGFFFYYFGVFSYSPINDFVFHQTSFFFVCLGRVALTPLFLCQIFISLSLSLSLSIYLSIYLRKSSRMPSTSRRIPCQNSLNLALRQHRKRMVSWQNKKETIHCHASEDGKK